MCVCRIGTTYILIAAYVRIASLFLLGGSVVVVVVVVVEITVVFLVEYIFGHGGVG